MANFDAGLASGYVLRINANETSTNAPANNSNINWYLEILKGSGSGKFAGGPHYWSVNIAGQTYSGSFSSYDFRNYTQLTLAAGNTTVGRNADGTGSAYIGGSFDDGNQYGLLGDGLAQGNIGLATLKVKPGTPTNVTGSRVSDTSITVSWSQSSASNGQPLSNQVERSINGAAFVRILDISPTTSVSTSAAANQKLTYRVSAWNEASFGGMSAASAPVYTTPGAPTNAVATKTTGLDIGITFTENVAYAEHTHEVWHGAIAAGGAITWDAAPLATLGSNVTSYTHVAPDSGQVHVYRVRSRAGSLGSSYTQSNSVQLLVAPNKPTIPAMPAIANKALALKINWVHNPIDTTPQTGFEFSYSTNNGTTFTSGGRVASSTSSHSITANAFPANTVINIRVRTWGSATTGGSEGTGASPYSDITTVTFKTVPTATVTKPASGSTVNDATVRVNVGFSQPEGATFVSAQLELLQGATLVEELSSSIQVGITLETQVQNGLSYTIRARVRDSNGLWSAWASSAFNVVYLAPVPAAVTVSYLPDNGYGQIDLLIAAPGTNQSAAATVTITRKINGVVETVVSNYPAAADLTFLDTTPTINGTNIYTITTFSSLGAQSAVTATLVTNECRRAYLSKGANFTTVAVFGANLSVNESLSVASDTVEAAGRTRPIGLYGVETSVQLKIQSFIFEGFGSAIDEVRTILLVPGKACYRDGSGRRVFGSVKGSLSYKKATRGELSFTLTETS